MQYVVVCEGRLEFFHTFQRGHVVQFHGKGFVLDILVDPV